MRVLIVTANLPYPPVGGAQMRVYMLAKQLSRRHEVTLIAFDRDPDIPGRAEALRDFCAEVVPVPLANHQLLTQKRKQQLISLARRRPYQYTAAYAPEMQRTIDHYLATRPFDIVQIEFSQMGYYHLRDYSRSVLDQHNVEYELLHRIYQTERLSLRKLYSFSEWWKFRRQEIAICERFTTVLTTSERDRATLEAQTRGPGYAVIPNGVDCDYFTNPAPLGHDNVILFTGTINYFPNTDGLKYFLEEIYPRVRQAVPDVQLCIAGKNPPPEIQRYAGSQGVTITGYLEDIRSVFATASLVIVPLRVGGGTRLKILEAMSMQRAVVATSIGAEGIDVTHGENILLADDPESFARSVVTLLHDRAQRQRLAAAGRRLVEQKYDWKLIGDRLEQVYAETIERARERAGLSRSYAVNTLQQR